MENILNLTKFEQLALIVMATYYGRAGWHAGMMDAFDCNDSGLFCDGYIYDEKSQPDGESTGDYLARKGYFISGWKELGENRSAFFYSPTFKGLWAGFILNRLNVIENRDYNQLRKLAYPQ